MANHPKSEKHYDPFEIPHDTIIETKPYIQQYSYFSWQFISVQLMTLARCILVIPIIFLLYSGYPIDSLFAFILAIIAGNLDWMDGFFARRWKVTSAFGKFFDPMADKIFFLTALIALHKFLKIQLILIIVAIEFLLIMHRVFVMLKVKTADVSANKAGKFKSIFQNIVICALILGQYLEQFGGSWTAYTVDWLGHTLLYISLGLSFVSLGVHLHRHGIIRLH